MNVLAEWIRVKLHYGADPGVAQLISSTAHEIPRQSRSLHEAHLRIEELAAANRRKDEFLAMLSHELRSPLASIHYALAVLARQTRSASAQERMQRLIERQLGRMNDLVDELLDISRISSGHLHVHRERTDLRVILKNSIETIEPSIHERDQQLSTELPEAPVWLQADPRRLEQVFVNLLANASRYTDARGELKLRAHARQGQAIVGVRDSGVGIAADALPHIFDLFKQGDEADPRSRAGLGLGLALVRNLVELHGGSVTVVSAGTGQGSEFTVRLPTDE
jgi:signal transduction histidine kinase